MQEMLQSPQQHYESLCSLLRRIQCNKEALQELTRWGLVLSPDIHTVRLGGSPGCGSSAGAASGLCSSQTHGRILPSERVNLRHCSFIPAEGVNWNKEVVREAAISTVSARPGSAAPEQRGFVGLGRVLSALPPAVCLSAHGAVSCGLPCVYFGFASRPAFLKGCVDEAPASPLPPGPRALSVARPPLGMLSLPHASLRPPRST